MKLPILLVGLSLFAQTELSAQSEKTKSDLANRVHQLVLQLDARALEDRNAAEQALVELGHEALNLLPPTTSSTPAEVKERLRRVREALEKKESQAIMTPTHVTLQGSMSVVNALRALETQTSNRLIGFENRTGEVQLEIEKAVYWKALDEILDKANLNINPFGGEPNAAEIVARGKGQLSRLGRATYVEIFRIEAIRLEARRELRDPTVDTLRLSVEITWEPRVSPIAFRQPLARIEAFSEQGTELLLGDRPAVLNASVAQGISAVELSIPLELPDRGVRQIAKLRGTLDVLVPGRVEAFEFDDLVHARSVSKQRAGVSVLFERFRKNLDLYEARIAVRFDEAGDALASHRGWIYNNKAYLLDADGNRIESVGGNPTHQRSDEVGFAYIFELPDGPDGCRFVYETPAMILHVPVEYELNGIDLP